MPSVVVQSPLEDFVAAVPEHLRCVVDALCAEVLVLHPDATVLAWPKQRIVSFGLGPKKMSEHYAYIGVQSKHANLGFYYGTSLPDPTELLEGTGKSLRHIKVGSESLAHSTHVRELLLEAIRELKVRTKTAV